LRIGNNRDSEVLTFKTYMNIRIRWALLLLATGVRDRQVKLQKSEYREKVFQSFKLKVETNIFI